MDLNEQAERAVNEAFSAVGAGWNAEAHRAAKVVWIDGYQAGMRVVQEMAEASFERLQAELS